MFLRSSRCRRALHLREGGLRLQRLLLGLGLALFERGKLDAELRENT
jgi:hypothetical protein